MNDWEITKFLKVILAIQFSMWGVIGLDIIGLQIPIIRQLIGFVYLTFVPGIVILRILKLHKFSNIETLLYTVGLSLATLMFTGFFMNMIYPFFGISKPISITPLIITISIVVLALCILSYLRAKKFSDPDFIDIEKELSSSTLFLCSLPFMAIFGTYLMNFYQDNILLMFLIIIIALIVVLIAAFDKIPKDLYPLAVFVIAVSLLYHNSLISMYLWGWDIQVEYYYSNLVMITSHWNLAIPSSYNGMLSIAILSPIYSNILSMELRWVYKIIYPFLLSMVPLGLYHVFRRQADDKIAFLSCFFFVSIFVFHTEMLQLAKQQIAEVFFVLLILLMISKNMDKIKRSFLFVVFGTSLAVSHYGTSYIYMAILIFTWLILVLIDNPRIKKLGYNFRSKINKYKSVEGNPTSLKVDKTLSSTFVLLFLVFSLTWYIHVSKSSPFEAIVNIGDQIVGSVSTELLKPETTEGMRLLLIEPSSLLHSVAKYLHHISQFFILIGIFTLLLKRKPMKFEKEFVAFSTVNLLICGACIVVPYFSSSLATTRLYHITLFVLAPFCVIGGMMVFRALNSIIRSSWANKSGKNSLKVFSVFLVIYLLFNTGFVYQVAGDNCTAISLNKSADYPLFNQKEYFGAEWICNEKKNTSIYADDYRWLLITNFEQKVQVFPFNVTNVPEDSYVYLGTLNIKKGEVLVSDIKPARLITRKYINSNKIIDDRNKIYDNGGSRAYY